MAGRGRGHMWMEGQDDVPQAVLICVTQGEHFLKILAPTVWV